MNFISMILVRGGKIDDEFHRLKMTWRITVGERKKYILLRCSVAPPKSSPPEFNAMD